VVNVSNEPSNRKPAAGLTASDSQWWNWKSKGKQSVVRGAGSGLGYPAERGRGGSGASSSGGANTSPATALLPPKSQTGGSSNSGSSRRTGSMQPTRQLPSMPEIGRPESFYAKLVHTADRQGDTHAHEAAKVGQYVTLAMDPSLSWEDKLKYFQHALKRHCVPPPYPDDDVWMFYQQLAELVRAHCGQEALRLASLEDDLYAARLSMGQSRDKIEDDAEQYFGRLLGSGDHCSEWFNDTDWSQLKLIRDQWI
jgi:hypothetical protein